MKKYVLIGFFFLVLAQAMVGINIALSKLLLYAVPLEILLVLRFLMASLMLFIIHYCSSARTISLNNYFNDLEKRDWAYILAQSLTAGLLFNCFILAGLKHTDANIAGIITSALPALIAFMSWAILKEKLSKRKTFSIFFASMGLIIIAGSKLNIVNENHTILGDILVFLSLLPEATYYILCKLYINRLPLFLASALVNGINAIILLPLLFFFHFDPLSLTWLTWVLLFLSGLGSGLFYVFWFIGAEKVEANMASLATAIMPVSAVIAAWIILDEKMDTLEFAGMSLVIFSIILYAKK